MRIELGERRAGALDGAPARCALTVRDTGDGMAPDVAERAFEPFFTTKPKGEGTGLGLATVYGIVTQTGGTVEIDSRAPGAGTTFEVLLPATDAEPPAAAGLGRRRRRRHGGETILVVEDEEAVRRLTCRILAREGYTRARGARRRRARSTPGTSTPARSTCCSPTWSCPA